MKPRVSTYNPFDYEAIKKKSLYMYLSEVNGEVLPHIVLAESVDFGAHRGTTLVQDGDGVCIGDDFKRKNNKIDMETITADIDVGVCKWLESVNARRLEIY